MSAGIDLTRALSFGATAEEYDRVRPSYPAPLIDDLEALHPLAVLDVGAGTGKASELLVTRGLDVLAVEADARMAAIVERKGIAVEVSPFQDWDARGRTLDLSPRGSRGTGCPNRRVHTGRSNCCGTAVISPRSGTSACSTNAR